VIGTGRGKSEKERWGETDRQELVPEPRWSTSKGTISSSQREWLWWPSEGDNLEM